jgi:DNA-binding SARP family transcriptional activator
VIEVNLFGAVGVRVDRRPVEGLTYKQRQVLAILALGQGVPVSREAIADQLWEGDPPRTWIGTLDSYICVIRRALGTASGRGSALATTDRGFLLHADVDLAWFHRLAGLAATNRSGIALDWAEDAMALAGADLLADVPYAGWAEHAREEFHQAFVALGTRSAQLANGCGEHDRASALARRVLQRDQVCEAAWVQLMLAHWFAGQRARALQDFAELREVAVRELGEEPGASAQELYLTILRTPTAPTGSGPDPDAAPRERLHALLALLRSELEQVPGVAVPPLDRDLSSCAARVLAES